MYILNVLLCVFKILDQESKVKYAWLQLFFLFSSLIQIVGVVSIAPFIGILSNPEIIHSSPILTKAYQYMSVSTDTEFIIAFAVISLALIFFANFIAGVTIWLSFRFSVQVGSTLQNTLFNNLLHREYIFHKTHNDSNSIALVNQEAPRFIYMVLRPFLVLTSQLFIVVLILLGLLILNPVIAIVAGAIVTGTYLATYIYLRNSLAEHGKVVSKRNRGVQETLTEAFIGIKDVKLSHTENIYRKRFSNYNTSGLSSNAFISLAGDLPKLVIEAISFGSILLLAIALLATDSSTGEVMATLSLYAVAGYKLLPSMQQVYKSISEISANGAVVMRLAQELETPIINKPVDIQPLESHANTISINNVTFKYPNSEHNALTELSITFHKGTINTIAGPSGSGKSTLADILLGLLIPEKGKLLLNNHAITNDDIFRYQNTIGYVPQQIFLINDTVAANVAFGTDKEIIDDNRVDQALRLANAIDFVQKMPLGKNTILGQDGKLLSGGQRQRIGIARALYKRTSVLILDEPTSALDINSEHEFMNCLHKLKGQLLIILISHRPAAIKLSDNIIIIDSGKLSACGSYNDLIINNSDFKTLMHKAAAEK